jgi:hypothetical protein
MDKEEEGVSECGEEKRPGRVEGQLSLPLSSPSPSKAGWKEPAHQAQYQGDATG